MNQLTCDPAQPGGTGIERLKHIEPLCPRSHTNAA
jgi:hypothetical protein